MILTCADDGSLEIVELRHDEKGNPLLAAASGQIQIGDTVLAINDQFLARNGLPTLQSAANEMKAASRPVRVLFQRGRSAHVAQVQAAHVK